MIRVVRPVNEPPELAHARGRELPRVAALIGAQGPLVATLVIGRLQLPVYHPGAIVPSEEIRGYQVARSSLFQAQHEKCCYCERYPEEQWQDVEHFRPKSAYWWLAWTWENLLFSCKACNEGEGKLDYFPLEGGAVLQPSSQPPYGQGPPGSERPWLVNPATFDPMNEIQFQPDGQGGWRPYPRHGSRKGAELIAACRLDRQSLRTMYRSIATDLEPERESLKEVLRTGNSAEISEKWERSCRRQLRANAPFAALRFDFLDHHFPPTQRVRHGLTLSLRHPDNPALPWP